MSDGSLGSLHRWRSQRIAKLLVVWIARHIGPILVAAEHLTYWTYISLSRLIYCIQHTVDCSALGWECFITFFFCTLHTQIKNVTHILNFLSHKQKFSFNIFSCHSCYAIHILTHVNTQTVQHSHTYTHRHIHFTMCGYVCMCVSSGYFLTANIHTHIILMRSNYCIYHSQCIIYSRNCHSLLYNQMNIHITAYILISIRQSIIFSPTNQYMFTLIHKAHQLKWGYALNLNISVGAAQ